MVVILVFSYSIYSQEGSEFESESGLYTVVLADIDMSVMSHYM